MKRTTFKYFLLSLMISTILSQLSEKERKNLLEKIFKRNNPEDLEKWNLFAKANDNSDEETKKYDPQKIKEIINKYKFPESYNFIDVVKPTVHIKNQENCGCCWAFASTTALAYRYFKKGIDIDLSPQYMLSCFSGDCDSGGYLVDTQFLLVKNGTVTETCMPFTSAEGTRVEECPTRCKNSEEFVKYKAKNPYSATFDFTFNYYDVVTIMMDQLINYGPLVTNIMAYEDLSDLRGPRCKNIIYKYDGKSEYEGGHAVVIVGYGYQNSKYYWIIQNSWGESFCDNGFAKIEFGQINIENVVFSEPYIEAEEDPEEKEISVKLNLRDDCRFEYIVQNDDDYEEPFEMYFKGENGTFYYQCNKAPFLDSTKGICNFDLESYNVNQKGIYKYEDSNLIFKNNLFNIEFNPDSDKQFYYNQYDLLLNVYIGVHNYYISEEGSGIILTYIPFSNESKFESNIYINNETKKIIKNCEEFMNLVDYSYIFCNISQDEIEYFDKENKNISLIYDILCGKKEEIPVFVHQLDKTKYPIFRVKYFLLPYSTSINYYTELSLIVNIEGSISDFTSELSYFLSFIKIIRNNRITELEIGCEIPEISKIQNNYEIICFPMIDSYYTSFSYDEIFLLPYNTPYQNPQPFEVIIKNSLKGISYSEYQDILSNESKDNEESQTDKKYETDEGLTSEEIDNEEKKENEPENPSENNCQFIKISLILILNLIFIIP